MLPKKNRLNKKLVEEVFKESRSISSESFTFKWRRVSHSARAASFIVPKSLLKGAATRNTLRRAGYRALQRNWAHFPAGVIGAFIFKTKKVNQKDLEQEVKTVLTKA